MKIKINNHVKNITLTIDKLQLNLKGQIESFIEIYNLIEESKEKYFIDNEISLGINSTYSKRYFKYTLDVFYGVDNFAHIHIIPANSYQRKELFQLTIVGERFYQFGWTNILRKVFESLKLHFHSVSNLHLALDANDINDSFIELFYSDRLKLTARPNPRGVVCNKTKRIKPDEGIKLGSTKSNWCVSFYRKSKDYEHKIHIKNFHEMNGIDTSGNVDRCELRLNNAEALKYSIDVFGLESEINLVSIFKQYSDAKLSFKHLDDFSYQNNNKVYVNVPLFAFPEYYDNTRLKKSDRYIKSTGKIKSKKTAIKQFVIDHLSSPAEYKVKFLKEFTIKYGLRNWLNQKFTHWTLEANKERIKELVHSINDDRTVAQIVLDFWKAVSWTSPAWIFLAII